MILLSNVPITDALPVSVMSSNTSLSRSVDEIQKIANFMQFLSVWIPSGSAYLVRFSKDNAYQIRTKKRAERTECDSRCSVCRSAIGQTGQFISVHLRLCRRNVFVFSACSTDNLHVVIGLETLTVQRK